MKIGGAINSSTIYGDNASATEGGDDSISIAGTASGSYIYANSGDDSVHIVGNVTASEVYLNTGDDSVSIDAGLIASTIYGGEGKDSVYVVNGASTAALIDGGVGNDFLSLAVFPELLRSWVEQVKTQSQLQVQTQPSGWLTLVSTTTRLHHQRS